MIGRPEIARAILEFNPLRIGYSLFSDKNPMMYWVGRLAEQVQATRTVPAADNRFALMQHQFSEAMVDALNLYRDMRDQLVELTFHAIYGSPLVQAAYGISQHDGSPRPRPGISPSILQAREAETRRLIGRMAKGGPLEAAARTLCYIGKVQHRVDEPTFNSLLKLLLAHPEVSLTEFKAALREQWAILSIDERAAIEALPELLPPDDAARATFLEMIGAILTTVGLVNADAQHRLDDIKEVLVK